MTLTDGSIPTITLLRKNREPVGNLTVTTLSLAVEGGDRRFWDEYPDPFVVDRIDVTVYETPGPFMEEDQWLTTAIGSNRAEHLTNSPTNWDDDGEAPGWFTDAVIAHTNHALRTMFATKPDAITAQRNHARRTAFATSQENR
jgi:hypothetical protein